MQTVTVYKGSELVTSFDLETGAGGDTPRQPMPQIQRIALVGASIFDQSFNSQANRDETAALIRNAGVDSILSINTDYSNDGHDSAQYLAKLDAMVNDAAGLEGMLFVIHGFGNDVTRNGPWPGGADQYESAMLQIMQRLLDAGHMVAWCSNSYRRYGADSHPVAPYNARINTPIIRDLTPEFMDGDRPWFDLYSVTYDHQELLRADGIHPTDRMRAMIRGYVARRIAGLIKAETPAKFEDFLGKTVVFNLGGSDHQEYSDGINGFVTNNEPGTSTDSTQGLGHCLQVYDTEGVPLNGVTLFAEYGNVNTVGATTDSGVPDLMNAIVVRDSLWSSPNVNGRAVIQGLPNGLTGTLSAVAARLAGDTRSGEYTYRDVTQTMEGAVSEGQEPPVVSWPFVIEEGEMQIDWGVSDGSEWAYLNGIMLEFDA